MDVSADKDGGCGSALTWLVPSTYADVDVDVDVDTGSILTSCGSGSGADFRYLQRVARQDEDGIFIRDDVRVMAARTCALFVLMFLAADAG